MTVSGWTNQAEHPSNARDRGLEVTHHLMQLLDVPQCAQVPLASNVVDRSDDRPLFVGNTIVETFQESYDTTMGMTFRKDGEDYVTQVKPDVQEPFVAEVYTYACNNTITHVAYMPKCGNLALLTPLEGVKDPGYARGRDEWLTSTRWGDGFTGADWGGGFASEEHNEVVEPGTVLLIIIGMLVAWLVHLWQKRARRTRKCRQKVGDFYTRIFSVNDSNIKNIEKTKSYIYWHGACSLSGRTGPLVRNLITTTKG